MHAYARGSALLLKEYLRGLYASYGWKLPLGPLDRAYILYLKIRGTVPFGLPVHITNGALRDPFFDALMRFLQKHGIVDLIKEKTPVDEFFSFRATKSLTIEGRGRMVIALGTDRDRRIALSKAVGEIVERVVSGVADMNSNILIASPHELIKKDAHSVLYPPQFHRFLPDQKKMLGSLAADPLHPIAWVGGRNLITHKRTYIPKQLTSWFIGARDSSPKFCNPTSSGAAGYFTKEGAVLRGLLEVVQRDAFLVHWLTSTSPQKIFKESLPMEMQKSLKSLEDRNISTHLLDITAIPIPTVCIIAIDRQKKIPRIVVSASSGVSYYEACIEAIREIKSLSYPMPLPNMSSQEECAVSSDTHTHRLQLDWKKRGWYWHGEERVRSMMWFLSGKEISYQDLQSRNISSAQEDATKLEACLDVLRALGPSFYPVAYWPKHSVLTRIGFHVVHVFIPKAFPLYLEERFGTFDSERLREFAALHGTQGWKLNLEPHMFL